MMLTELFLAEIDREAPRSRSALEQVRQAQGPDVVILSNRKVEGGVELLTAIGQPDAELLEKFTPRATRPRLESGLPSAVNEPETGSATVRRASRTCCGVSMEDPSDRA